MVLYKPSCIWSKSSIRVGSLLKFLIRLPSCKLTFLSLNSKFSVFLGFALLASFERILSNICYLEDLTFSYRGSGEDLGLNYIRSLLLFLLDAGDPTLIELSLGTITFFRKWESVSVSYLFLKRLICFFRCPGIFFPTGSSLSANDIPSSIYFSIWDLIE